MKYTFKFFQIFLLICGVFGADAVKTVSVMEGDSVTLNPDPTEIQGFILMLWRFGDPTIAQIDGKDISYPSHIDTFRGKLQLDQAGSLTIKNMRTKHSGLYQLQIDLNSGTSHSDMPFNVTVYESPSVIGAGKADMKRVSVMEGDSVPLQTDITELHEDELIVWRFGDEGKLIAKHDIEAKSSLLHDTDERFRDRLKLDEKTGSLTITNSRTTDSGLYTVKISSNKQTLYKRFIVTVSDSGLSSDAVAGIVSVLLLVFAAAAGGVIYYLLKVPKRLNQTSKTVVEGDSVTLKPVTEINKGDQIQWMFEDEGIKGGTGEIIASDGRFKGGVELDKTTGSLTITNTRTEDTGLYKILIRRGIRTLYEEFYIVVNASLKPVREGESLTLNPDTEIQKDDQIQWRFGDILIAEIRGGTGETHDDDVRFRGRLKLDEKTGSLTITRMREEHAGDYKLMISSSRGTTNKTFDAFVLKSAYISETVLEGEDVTLSSDTYVVKDDIIWLYGDLILAKGKDGDINKTSYCDDETFKDRLELDHQTGSLTIKNTRTSDRGFYRLKFLPLGMERKFRVTVNERNISVEEGKSVTLNPETEIQEDDQIQWRFGDQDIPIAEIRGGTVETHDDDVRFRGRLKLDEKTGSLIITNMRTEHTGDYKLQISNSRGTTTKRFVVTVYTSLKPVQEGESLTLNPDTEIQEDDQIQWRFGDQDILIAEIRRGTGKTHDDDGRFRGRLKLDEKTGSLTITRMREEHNGDYKLLIRSSRGTTNMTFRVFVVYRVYGAYTAETVLEGEDVTLSSDTYIVKDEVNWFFNDEILAIGKNGDINKTQYCDERFKDRLELDHQTGSLTIRNTRTSDDGFYRLKFLPLGIERKFRVTVNENRGNDSATVEMHEEDRDAGNGQEGMSLLVMR